MEREMRKTHDCEEVLNALCTGKKVIAAKELTSSSPIEELLTAGYFLIEEAQEETSSGADQREDPDLAAVGTKKRKGRPKKAELDIDKALALEKAGWSHKMIAEEFGKTEDDIKLALFAYKNA